MYDCKYPSAAIPSNLKLDNLPMVDSEAISGARGTAYQKTHGLRLSYRAVGMYVLETVLPLSCQF